MEQQQLFVQDAIYEVKEYNRMTEHGHECVKMYSNQGDENDVKFEAHFTVNKKVQVGPSQFVDQPMPVSYFFQDDVKTIDQAFEGFKEGAIEYLKVLEQKMQEAQQPEKKIVMASEADAKKAGEVINAMNRFKKND